MAAPMKIPAIVEHIIRHEKDVFTLQLVPQKRCPRFKPGQFLHLALDPYDPSFAWPESRVFSIANSPTRSEMLQITYSVKGRFTRRMADELAVGTSVWLKLPFGQFNFGQDYRELILIAGGTGITPFLSFLDYALDMKLNFPIQLYYGVRESSFIIFEKQLSDYQKGISGFHYELFLEKPDDKVTCKVGRIEIAEIIANCKDVDGADFFISGPSAMIEIFTTSLQRHGVCESNIHIDKWE